MRDRDSATAFRAVGVVAICSVLFVGCSTNAEESTTTAEPVSTTTLAPTDLDESGYAQLLELVAAGETDEVTLALTEFALHFGSVPGALDLPRDAGRPPTATGAVEAVSAVHEQLTEGQRRAVADRLEPYIVAVNAGPSAVAEQPTLLAAGVGSMTGSAAASAATDDSDIRSVASWAEGELESRLGGNPLVYSLTVLDREPPGGEGTTTPIVTLHPPIVEWVYDLLMIEPERDVSCDILIGPTFTARDAGAIRSGIAHEMFHCWSISQDLAGHLATPDWYQEGVASWVGEDLAGGTSYSSNWWHFYMTPAQLDITRSKYQAIGFWSWIDEHLPGGLWAAIPELHSIASGGTSGVLFTAATQTFDEATISGLAGARMREASLGEAWTMNGPGITSRHTSTALTLRVDVERGPDARPGMIAIERFAMPTPEGDEVLGLTLQGTGTWRALWSDGTELTSSTGPATAMWCLNEPCVCPDGTTLVGWDPLPSGADDLLLTATSYRYERSMAKVTVTDLCPEEVPPPDDEPGDAAALTGVWEATPQALNQMFANIFEVSEVGSLAGNVTGTAVITFDGAGGAELRYINVNVPFDSAGIVTDLGINGGGELAYTVSGSTISFTGTGLDLTFTLLGEEIELGPDVIPLGAPSEVIWGFDGDRLILQSESIDQSIPNQWVRNA